MKDGTHNAGIDFVALGEERCFCVIEGPGARLPVDFHRSLKYVTNLASCQDEEICIAFTTVEIRRFHVLTLVGGR